MDLPLNYVLVRLFIGPGDAQCEHTMAETETDTDTETNKKFQKKATTKCLSAAWQPPHNPIQVILMVWIPFSVSNNAPSVPFAEYDLLFFR